MNTQVRSNSVLQEEELFRFLKKGRQVLFTKNILSPASPLSFRSLNVELDLPTIHIWVNQSYAKKFWQLDVGLCELDLLYRSIIERENTHSIVACYRNQLVAQVDLYHAPADETGKCFPATKNDYGVHFLMAPLTEPIPSFSSIIFSAAIEFLFQFACVHRVIGEPDSRNVKANALVQRVGFRFQKQISLPDKVANLYFCEHSSFIPFH